VEPRKEEEVIHQIIPLSDFIVSEVLDRDHLPISFWILGHVITREISAQVETHSHTHTQIFFEVWTLI